MRRRSSLGGVDPSVAPLRQILVEPELEDEEGHLDKLEASAFEGVDEEVAETAKAVVSTFGACRADDKSASTAASS